MLEFGSNGHLEISYMNALQEAKAILLYKFLILCIPLHIKWIDYTAALLHMKFHCTSLTICNPVYPALNTLKKHFAITIEIVIVILFHPTMHD